MNLEQMKNEAQHTVNQLGITNVTVEVVNELVSDTGLSLNGEYKNGVITLALAGLQHSASYRGHNDIEVAAVLTLAHELGHHLHNHTHTEGRTVVDTVKQEMEAWVAGRNIIKLLQDTALLSLYDDSNFDNLMTYCHMTGATPEEAQILEADVRRVFPKIQGEG
jgi:Zn-dependent peptidase ImmA (M78 family)